MIVMHLCNRPDVTIVQNQLLKFLHVREGGRSLDVDNHDDDDVGDRDDDDGGRVGDDGRVGDRDGGVHLREG